jgi:hypothetical protein
MKTRKIVLLSAIAVLGAIAVLQAVVSGADSVRELKTDAKIDSIVIAKSGSEPLALAKSGDRWVAGERKYPVAKSSVDAMLAALESVRVLGSVSPGGDYERYGLDDPARITVTASAGGKVVRTIYAGKNSSTSQQSYALVDSGKAVLMVAGSLRGAFDKTIADVRDRDIWTVPVEGISRVDVDPDGRGNSSYAIAKAGEPAAWTLVPGSRAGKGDPDPTLAANWVGSLARLRADGFAPDDLDFSSLPTLGSAKLTSPGKVIEIAIRQKDGDKRYLCTSSETPYAFYVTIPSGSAFIKPYAELAR